MSKARQIAGWVGWLALSFVVISAGVVVQETGAGSWYASLAKPATTPPGWVFGPAWSLNCLLMGTAAWLVWRAGGFARRGPALTLFLLHLFVAGSFSWVFTPLESVWLGATIVAAALVLLTATAAEFFRVRTLAGVLLVPYWLWLALATSVAWGLVALNG